MKLLVFFCFVFVFFYPFTVSASSCDQWIRASGELKGVVVLGHGLNLRSDKMLPWAKALSHEGYEVFLPVFSGHCEGQEKFLHLQSQDWDQDLDKIYLEASSRAQKIKKPLFLVAYSFSALLFQTKSSKYHFQKKVFLAPALATKYWYLIVRIFTKWFPNFSYTSVNLPEYAANKKSGSRALIALDDFLQRWSQGQGVDDQTPILIWADKKDELVSYEGLQTLCAARNNWILEKIDNSGSTLKKSFHHLIIDKEAVGDKIFQKMITESVQFFQKN